MKGTMIAKKTWGSDLHFTSTNDYKTIKKWLKENNIWWYPAFFMHDTIVILSKKSYMAAKLTWY